MRACFRERRGLIAYLASYTPSCSLVCSRVFGCFPPHPTTCCVTITHLSVSRQRPTASNAASHHRGAASHHRGAASHHRGAASHKQRDDRDDDQHPRPQPRTLEKPTPAPHKSSTSRQPRRPRRPGRRPLGAATPSNTQKSSAYKQPRRPRRQPTQPPTPSNMLEHANSPHHRHQRRPAPRPEPRPAGTPIPSNTRKASTIDTHHSHKATTSRPRTDHHTPSPNTMAKHTPAKPDG